MANPRTTTSTTTGTTPEVLTSPILAAVIVPMLDEAAEDLAAKYREQGQSRMRDAALAGLRATARQIEAYHDGDGS